MTTYQTSKLSKPSGADPIPLWQLAYFQARNRSRVHDLVLREFQRSGVSKADLARRMHKRPEVISRLLGAPGNWGLDTISDLLFAICGGEPKWDLEYPLDGSAKNYCAPEWLEQPETIISTIPVAPLATATSPASGSISLGSVTLSASR